MKVPTKEEDIANLAREILKLADEEVDLTRRATDLNKQAVEVAKSRRARHAAMAALMGETYERRAFVTHDPTDGRRIVVLVIKSPNYSPDVTKVELLQGVNHIETGEVSDGEK